MNNIFNKHAPKKLKRAILKLKTYV